jgi:hypothetical protein
MANLPTNSSFRRHGQPVHRNRCTIAERGIALPATIFRAFSEAAAEKGNTSGAKAAGVFRGREGLMQSQGRFRTCHWSSFTEGLTQRPHQALRERASLFRAGYSGTAQATLAAWR